MVMIMKKGIYFTLNFKGLFSFILIGCLILSFVFFISEPKISSTTSNSSKQPQYKKQLIIIDAGHGGEDGGTVSAKGVNEKLINLEISKKLKHIFELCGYRTIMTRTDDRLIYDGSPSTIKEKKVSDLRNRLNFSESNPDGIFLSVHQNYFTQSKYWGTQVFYSANNPDSKLIAESIQGTVRNNLQQENSRKIKQSGKEIFLLYNIKSPAVMVECGFMSNHSEALRLEDNDYQIKMSLSIIDGVNNHLDIKGEI